MEEVFEWVILGGPLQRGIKTLDFLGASEHQVKHFLLHIFPKFQTSSTIVNLQEQHLHHALWKNYQSSIVNQAKVRQCAAALRKLACQTTHLQIVGQGGCLAQFLIDSGGTLRSLDITPLLSENVLGSSSFGWLAILAALPQLKELTIRSSQSEVVSLSDFISEEALGTPFPFADSLSTLNLHCQNTLPGGITLPLLLFIARFPSLINLALPHDYHSLPTNAVPKIRLSQLRRLEIPYSSILSYNPSVYRYFDAPSLQSLVVVPQPFGGEINDSHVDLINLNLAPLRQSLRLIEFPRHHVVENAARRIGGSRVLVTSRPAQRPFDKLLEVLEANGTTSDESDESDYYPDSDSDGAGESRRGFPRRSAAGDNLAFRGVEDLSSWISEKLQDLRIKDDIDGAKTLARTLERTSELRKWLND
ncbi:hypothetical protein JCM3765_005157 [Sporobolomyces pararoseus]